jgi:hypothetical protein
MTLPVKNQVNAATGITAVLTRWIATDSGFGRLGGATLARESGYLMSDLEDKFLEQVKAAGFPEPKREYRFHPTRKWRVDFYWSKKDTKQFPVAVEVEGGTFLTKSRHTSGVGFEKDCEKYNEMALANILLLRVTGKHVKDGRALEWLRRAALWEMDLLTAMRLSDGRFDE